MRAERLDDADAAVGIAEGHQVLAQELDPNRRTIGFGEFLWQQGWQPEAAQQLAHSRSRTALGQEFVVLGAQHDVLPIRLSWFWKSFAQTTARVNAPFSEP